MSVIRFDSTVQYLHGCDYLLCDLVVLQTVPTLLLHVQQRHLQVMHIDLLETQSSLVVTCGTMTVRWHAMRCPGIGLVADLFSMYLGFYILIFICCA